MIKTPDPTASWRAAIVIAKLHSGPTPYEAQKALTSGERTKKDVAREHIAQASAELDAFLKSDEGQLAQQLLRATEKQVVITSYRSDRHVDIYLNATGVYSTGQFGPDPTTLLKEANHLLESSIAQPNAGEVIIAKLKEDLSKIATEYLKKHLP